jgi:hypothetical protein
MEEDNIKRQGRQPDPKPPSKVPPQEPSIILYLVFLAVAIVLLLAAFRVSSNNWAGLLMNLATEIIGAIIILIIIDRRLRENEVMTIQAYAETTIVKVTLLLSKKVSTAVSFAQYYGHQLKSIRPDPYLERPRMEDLLEMYPKGFNLYGLDGTGKSTLLQAIALNQAEKVVHRPWRELIPFILPMRHRLRGAFHEQVWRGMCAYSYVEPKVFRNWLKKGRLLLILDGFEECVNGEHVLNEIRTLRKQHPKLVIIISSQSPLDVPGLPKVEMPPAAEVVEGKLIELSSTD